MSFLVFYHLGLFGSSAAPLPIYYITIILLYCFLSFIQYAFSWWTKHSCNWKLPYLVTNIDIAQCTIAVKRERDEISKPSLFLLPLPLSWFVAYCVCEFEHSLYANCLMLNAQCLLELRMPRFISLLLLLLWLLFFFIIQFLIANENSEERIKSKGVLIRKWRTGFQNDNLNTQFHFVPLSSSSAHYHLTRSILSLSCSCFRFAHRTHNVICCCCSIQFNSMRFYLPFAFTFSFGHKV